MNKLLLIQFILYGAVGLIGLLVDIGFFLLFMLYFGLPPLVATSLSFIFGTSLNYVLCSKLVFASTRGHTWHRVMKIFMVAGVGLLCNTLLFGLLLEETNLPPLWIKILVVPMVSAWNFLARRYFVFSPEIPAEILAKLHKFFGK
jgi:putative flippase GtrA